MARPLRVRVGIVSWNTADLLDRCLAALPDALGDDLEWHAVVVDNASEDLSRVVVGRHPAVNLVANPANVGYGRAMNQALDAPEADVLIALNPDTVPPPGSLATLVQRLLADPGVGLVAPTLLTPTGGIQHSAYRFPSVAVASAVSFMPPRWHRGALGRRFGLEGSAGSRAPVDVDWVMGAVHVIRAAAARRPLYDERWFMYVEDVELCWWLRQHGWRRRLEADIVVTHVGNAAGGQRWGDERERRWLRNTYDWYGRDRGVAARRRLATVNLLGAGCHVIGLSAAARFGSRSRSGERRARAAALARSWPIHLSALVRSPGPG